MDSLKEFIEKIKLWILDKIEDIRIFLGEQIVKVKEFVDKLKNRDSVPGGYTIETPTVSNTPAIVNPEIMTTSINNTPVSPINPQVGEKGKQANFFSKIESTMGKKFTKKFPNQVTVFTDRFLEIFASKKYQILLGTGIFMMLSSIYLLANLSYVFSEQKSVIDTQESTIGDGESLLKKLREFDVSTLTQADIEKNPDLDTFMYNQNSYLTTINNLRGETVRFGTTKWDEKTDVFSEINFVDVSRYATIDDLLTTFSFGKTWFKPDSLEISNVYEKDRGTPYFSLKFSGKLMK